MPGKSSSQFIKHGSAASSVFFPLRYRPFSDYKFVLIGSGRKEDHDEDRYIGQKKAREMVAQRGRGQPQQIEKNENYGDKWGTRNRDGRASSSSSS